jgi:hypothetical protein
LDERRQMSIGAGSAMSSSRKARIQDTDIHLSRPLRGEVG